MGLCIVFWVLGIIFLLIEWWFLTHLYELSGSFSMGYTYKKMSFKVLHLLLLVLLNIIPILNTIGFMMILLIPAIEDDIYFKLIPPGEEKETKISKLDKLLNKEL